MGSGPVTNSRGKHRVTIPGHSVRKEPEHILKLVIDPSTAAAVKQLAVMTRARTSVGPPF